MDLLRKHFPGAAGIHLDTDGRGDPRHQWIALPAERLADSLLLAGGAGWAIFSWWYIAGASVSKPDPSRPARNFARTMDPGQVLASCKPRSPRGAAGTVARAAALGQLLAGTGSTWSRALTGGGLAVVWWLAYRFHDSAGPHLPVYYLVFMPLFSSSLSLVLVRRARLAWLHAGLDRAGLLTAARRQALGAAMATLALPTVVLVTTSLLRRPDLPVEILLFTTTQLVANACFVHAGLTVTRGWDLEQVLKFTGLGLLFVVVTVILQPHEEAPVWLHMTAIALFGALAIALHRSATRAWRTLDWRIAGPLPAGVGPGR